MNKFFMVWRAGTGKTNVQHPTYDLALAEAQRLMAKERVGAFVVLEAQTLVKATEPTVVTEGLYPAPIEAPTPQELTA